MTKQRRLGGAVAVIVLGLGLVGSTEPPARLTLGPEDIAKRVRQADALLHGEFVRLQRRAINRESRELLARLASLGYVRSQSAPIRVEIPLMGRPQSTLGVEVTYSGAPGRITFQVVGRQHRVLTEKSIAPRTGPADHTQAAGRRKLNTVLELAPATNAEVLADESEGHLLVVLFHSPAPIDLYALSISVDE